MPPRKTSPKPADEAPPGPIFLELRVDGKVQFRQPVHSYEIDQTDDTKVVITGVVRLLKTTTADD
jgi:hypothetical protein